MAKHVDILNKRFGRLLAKEEICKVVRCGIRTTKEFHIICICDCGKETTVRKSSLIYGATKSCGCLKGDALRNVTKNFHTLPYGEAALNLILRGYKNGAIKRGLSWDLSRDSFKKITSSNCFYCGIEPKQSALAKRCWRRRDRAIELNGDYIYNGIDRINGDIGYTIANVVPCCGNCNVKKNKMSPYEFYEWIKRVYLHLESISFQLPTGTDLRNPSLSPSNEILPACSILEQSSSRT